MSVLSAARAEVLRRSFIFSALKEEELEELADLATERSLAPEDFLLREGDAPEWFYVVAQGRVKVIKQSSLGRELIMAFFGPGEMVGEVAVFENRPYPASAQVVAETRVLGIRRAAFLSFLAQRPEVALRIINVLGGRLRESQGRLMDIAGERVEQRVARILLMLSAKFGSTLPFTRQDIADMAGTTPETAIRVMSRLKEAGIIRSQRGKTIILDDARLKVLSEGRSQP